MCIFIVIVIVLFFGDELDGVNPFISFSSANKQLLLLLLSQASDTFS